MNPTPLGSPPTPHAPARARRALRFAAAAMVCGLLPAGARAADAVVSVPDKAGDVVIDPSGPLWKAPDIFEASIGYLTGSDADPTDDRVVGSMRVSVSPDPTVANRLYAARGLSWRIDSDGDPNTGSPYEPGRGAEFVVVALSAEGASAKGYIRRWMGTQFEYPGQPVAIAVDPATGTYSWSLSPVDVGIVRGRAARVWFASAYAPVNNRPPEAEDLAPDDRRPSALLAPFPAPAGALDEPSALNPTSATITGTVSGLGTTAEWFVEYTPLGGTPVDTPLGGVPSDRPVPISAPLAGLTPGTTYAYQLVVRNQWGESRTPVRSFVTPLPAPPAVIIAGGDPGAAQTPPTTATSTGVVFTGTVVPRGASNQWWFEWGPTAALGHSTTATALAQGAAPVPVSARVENLSPSTTYHYRLVVVSDGVRSQGDVQTITTAGVARLSLAGRVRVACATGACRLTSRSTVRVRVRTAADVPLKGKAAVRGVRATVRCVKVCAGRRAVRVRATSGDARITFDRTVQRWRLRRGAVVELRVTRRGSIGALYRMQVTKTGVVGRVCRLSIAGVSECPLPRRAAVRAPRAPRV